MITCPEKTAVLRKGMEFQAEMLNVRAPALSS
jgi:hypothetical protein